MIFFEVTFLMVFECNVLFLAVCCLIPRTILHLEFVSICKSKRGLPNYLFKVDHRNVGVRKLDNYWKKVRD